jgi:hypothetical protein
VIFCSCLATELYRMHLVFTMCVMTISSGRTLGLDSENAINEANPNIVGKVT